MRCTMTGTTSLQIPTPGGITGTVVLNFLLDGTTLLDATQLTWPLGVPDLIHAICLPQRTGTLSETVIYDSAKSRRFEETVVALALMSGVPIEAAETAMLDDAPDTTLILAKAAGLSWTTVKFVLLLRAGGHSVSAHELEAGLKSYEQLSDESAQLAVGFYQRRRRLAQQSA